MWLCLHARSTVFHTILTGFSVERFKFGLAIDQSQPFTKNLKQKMPAQLRDTKHKKNFVAASNEADVPISKLKAFP